MENNERPYGNSTLLNEVHHYFPALLYDNDQFNSVENVFDYVNYQMNVHHNTYNRQTFLYRRGRGQNARRNFERVQQNGRGGRVRVSQPIRQQNMTPVRTTINQATPLRHINVPISPRLSAESPDYSPSETPTVHFTPLNSDLLTTILTSFIYPPNFNDAVLVAPSNAQILAGTTSLESLTTVENGCAVCQDTINSGDQVRILNHCGHTFHTVCIDTWFHRNVRCPVCRHDIRDTNSQVPPPLNNI